MALDFKEIRELLAAIAQTDITEVILKSDEFEITVRKAVNLPAQILPMAATSLPVIPAAPSPVAVSNPETPRPPEPTTNGGGQSPSAPSPIEQKKYVDVTSPMVGTFYRAPAPGESAFAEVGDRVRSNQTVCIIEAMKLMNEIEAEVSGQIVEILAQNGEPVEYGQVLMRINPD
ncbi:acetyl-CoA carboxylase biotin carboxyl carrier protein [Calothrix sp. 336/3]|uniref:acetyl-CoA carboxylase biotin carboxyl carrier protein n=1 Tax=Calothrix sp. 336/3 TaxID=1337936 RepID=UPI0004E446F1|nr:acetyl-CoA carboxylase biotin carboxyl carrier protein [Calothrix sp. 336/3]AKG24013.1 carboxylesterase [Calothrix sp. 336/3]